MLMRGGSRVSPLHPRRDFTVHPLPPLDLAGHGLLQSVNKSEEPEAFPP